MRANSFNKNSKRSTQAVKTAAGMEQATANDATCGVLIQEIKQAASGRRVTAPVAILYLTRNL